MNVNSFAVLGLLAIPFFLRRFFIFRLHCIHSIFLIIPNKIHPAVYSSYKPITVFNQQVHLLLSNKTQTILLLQTMVCLVLFLNIMQCFVHVQVSVIFYVLASHPTYIYIYICIPFYTGWYNTTVHGLTEG